MAGQVIITQEKSRSPGGFQEIESFQGTGTVRQKNHVFSEILNFYFFRKLFRLPSILTSDNAGTWLVTRKGNKNDNEKKTVAPLMNDDNDNSKWLAPQPKSDEVKVETDVVTLTGRLTKLKFTK